MAEVRDCSFELGPYPSYSPDLAPSDNYHLLKMKNTWHDGITFAVRNFFVQQDEMFFTNEIQAFGNSAWKYLGHPVYVSDDPRKKII